MPPRWQDRVGLAALTGNRKWLIVPGVVLSFLFQQAAQGWCPPVPVFRRLGVRTREEIDREKSALRALRGDFAGVPARSEVNLTNFTVWVESLQ